MAIVPNFRRAGLLVTVLAGSIMLSRAPSVERLSIDVQFREIEFSEQTAVDWLTVVDNLLWAAGSVAIGCAKLPRIARSNPQTELDLLHPSDEDDL